MKSKAFPQKLRIIIATLSLCATIAAFIKANSILSTWISSQAGPTIVKFLASFSISALTIVLFLAITALLFGRFYCSLICPFGILQDVINFINPLKKTVQKYNFKKTRYLIATISIALLATGIPFVFLSLDPYSNFGRIAAVPFNPFIIYIHNLFAPSNYITHITIGFKFLISCLTPLIILIILIVLRKRFFCTSLCPVGTLLGLCSKKSLFQLKINKNICISCRNCQKHCPCGCIDIQNDKFLDNETCVKCMTCKAKCPVKAISYNSHRQETNQITDLTKRDFLIGAACTATAFGLGSIFNRFVKITKPNVPVIVPPGAGSRERFASKCTECLLCVTNCPGHVLTFGGQVNAVHLDFNKGFCEYNCNTCSKICPTGAIDKISLKEKKLCRIGLAELELPRCVTITDKTECGACAEQCPTGALQMKPGINNVRIPYFIHNICIGCGACQNACPVRPKTAVWVNPTPLQIKAENPIDFFSKQNTYEPEPKNSQDWSF